MSSIHSPVASAVRTIGPRARGRGALLAVSLAAIGVCACGGGASLTEAGRDGLLQVVFGVPGDTAANLQWTASTDARVRGYRVYHGRASRSYEQRKGDGIDVGNVTTYHVKYLEPGATYYFAVTAYAADGTESDESNETAKAIASP
jgi:hypothetical protein